MSYLRGAYGENTGSTQLSYDNVFMINDIISKKLLVYAIMEMKTNDQSVVAHQNNSHNTQCLYFALVL